MKTLTKVPLLVLLSSMIAFNGCQKENLSTDQKKAIVNTFSDKIETDCSSNIGIFCNDILSFNDMDQFRSVYECLDASYEQWNADFQQAHSNLNETQYNNTMDQLGFDEEQPLIDFENSLSFYSIRKKISDAEQIWLSDPNADLNADPDDDQLDDEIMRTLCSAYYEVKIANKLFFFHADGRTFVITNPTSTTVSALRANPDQLVGQSGVTVYTPSPNQCRSWKRDHDYITYAPQRMYKWILRVRTSGPIGTFFTSKLISYKIKSDGSKKRWATNVSTNHIENIYDLNCSTSGVNGATKGPLIRKVIRAKLPLWGDVRYTRSGEYVGYYMCNGYYSSHTMTW